MPTTNLIEKAVIFAMEKHKLQKRRLSGLPYIVHCHGVAWLIRLYKKSKNIESLIAAAYLHDVIEDCGVTAEELEKEFGPLVTSLVVELTNDKTIKKYNDKVEHIAQKVCTISNYALTIKLCDILHNLIDSHSDAVFQKNFSAKTQIIIDRLLANRKLTKSQHRIVNEILRVLELNNA